MIVLTLKPGRMSGRGCFICSEIHTAPCPNRWVAGVRGRQLGNSLCFSGSDYSSWKSQPEKYISLDSTASSDQSCSLVVGGLRLSVIAGPGRSKFCVFSLRKNLPPVQHWGGEVYRSQVPDNSGPADSKQVQRPRQQSHRKFADKLKITLHLWRGRYLFSWGRASHR